MQNKELSLSRHLDELRTRLIYYFAALFLSTVATIAFIKPILDFLRFPAKAHIDKFAFFSPQEVVFVYTKIVLAGGLVLSSPVFFYQLWLFILPAIDDRKRRHFLAPIFFVTLIFVLGCIFGYFFLLPFSLNFLIGLGVSDFTAVISIDKYISFVLAILLGCGLVFEIPVVIWLLTHLGAVDYKLLRRKRKYIIAVIFILAAIITPTTDPFNMCLLAIPMLILYEVGILISYFNRKARNGAAS